MRIFALLLITVAMGCATPLPEEKSPYDARAHVQDVTKNCNQTHLLYGTEASPVDCFIDYPRNMTLSFPSTAFHNEHIDIVLQFHTNWCSSVEAAAGDLPHFTRIFRQEQRSQSEMCESSP